MKKRKLSQIYQIAPPLAFLAFLILTACGQAPQSSDSNAMSAGAPSQGAKLTVLDPSYTTGALCTQSDQNFAELRYPEKIPYCNRNISTAEKQLVASHYGIPSSEYSQYEFDHFIPLAIGGSNDPSNLWPQRLDQAKIKDGLEMKLYNEMAAGKVSQAAAVAQIRQWQPGK